MNAPVQHEGPGHGDATLSLMEELHDGTQVYQSWPICACTLPALRARLGPPEHESVADAETVRRVAEAALAVPGNVMLEPE